MKPRCTAPRGPIFGIVFFAMLALPQTTLAQESMTGIAVPVTLDFTAFTGTGFTPTPAAGQLDSDAWAIAGMSSGTLAFGGTQTTLDFARGGSTGGVTTGGIYSFDVDGIGDTSLGVQPGGSDMTPGTITLWVDNNTGDQVDEVTVSYDVYVNNDQERANTFNFSFSTDAGGGGTYTSVPALDLTSTEVSDGLGFVGTARMTTLTGLAANLQNGDALFLRWELDDVSGAGSRDEFAVDNIVVTATTVPVELYSFSIE